MKIAIIGLRALGYPAGIDYYVTEVATRLANRGHNITVYCHSNYSEKSNEHNHIRIVRIPTVKNKYLGTPLYAFFSTLNVIGGKYDIIHYHGLGSALCSAVLRLLGKKTIVTVHALDWEGKKWGFFAKKTLQLAGMTAAKCPNMITVVSGVVKSYFEDHYHCKPQCISNGANVLPSRGPELIKKYGLDKENYILFLGRLTPGKGCEHLIEAFNQMDLNLKLVIAGDAIHERDYVKWLKSLAGENTVFTGWVGGQLKEELLSNAYLFVQPSELEGMSGVLLEAMSYGRCVIASDIPQNLEVIGDAGFSFKNKDVKGLKELIESLIVKEDEVAKSGVMARERVLKHYHWDKIANDWEKAYHSLVGQKGW